MQNYLFVDVDGVLNCEDTYKNAPKFESKLDDEMIRRLASIVNITQARIVISSSWRLSSRSMDDLLSGLAAHGLVIYGITPDTFGNRADQISDWIEIHGGMRNKAIVILDDDIIEEPMTKYQVKTKWSGSNSGLQVKQVKECLELFEQQQLANR